MGEKVEVLFGRSYTYPDTIVVEKVRRVGRFEDDEGNQVGTEYNAEAESWMARTDMNCMILSVSESSLDVISKAYIDFVEASWEEPCDEEKVGRLRKEFLLTVSQ